MTGGERSGKKERRGWGIIFLGWGITVISIAKKISVCVGGKYVCVNRNPFWIQF